MKLRYFITAVAASALLAMNAQNPVHIPYILPLNDDGSLSKDTDGNYSGTVAMTADSDGNYSASNVDLTTNGFVFYAVEENTDNPDNTLYGLPSWAVNPPVKGTLPNPLFITTESVLSTSAIKIEANGTYNVTYYPSSVTGYPHQMFSIVPSDQASAKFYPEKLYIVSSNNSYIEIPQTEITGVYADTGVTFPSSFKIAYEPQYNYAAYIYGPAESSTSVTLEEAEPAAISYAKNTGATFSVSDEIMSKSPVNKANININLIENKVTVTKDIVLGVDGVDYDSDTPAEYYTLSGLKISGVPSDGGIYIVKRGTSVSKVLMR